TIYTTLQTHQQQHHTSSYSTTALFFFFNDTPTTDIYTLSLHDALPISRIWFFDADKGALSSDAMESAVDLATGKVAALSTRGARSEEHTSELQSLAYLVCRLLLEKKKNNKDITQAYFPNTFRCVHVKDG